MTAGGLLLTLAGLLLAAGLVGVAGAVRGVSFLPERSSSVRSSSRRGATPLFLGALAAGVLVLLVTGWPAAALGAAGGVVFIPKVLDGGKEAKRLIATSEALADWTRRLADLISSGAAGAFCPCEAWTRAVLSSIVTTCLPVACTSFSIRPRQGRM